MRVTDPHAGTVREEKQKTNVLAADTDQELKDVKAVIVIGRSSAHLADSVPGRRKRPRIVVEEFNRLDKLSYWLGQLHVFPFFALGTDYGGAHIFVYKRGYKPAIYEWQWPASYYP